MPPRSKFEPTRYIVGIDPGRSSGYVEIDRERPVPPKIRGMQLYRVRAASVGLRDASSLLLGLCKGEAQVAVEGQYVGRCRGKALVTLSQRAGVAIGAALTLAPERQVYVVGPTEWYKALGGSNGLPKTQMMNRLKKAIHPEDLELFQTFPEKTLLELLAAYGIACAVDKISPIYLKKSMKVYEEMFNGLD